jgi:hypothetical protein
MESATGHDMAEATVAAGLQLRNRATPGLLYSGGI